MVPERVQTAARMNCEEPSKENMFRLCSPDTGRAQMWRRWMHVLEMRQRGTDWQEIGTVLDRSPSTAKSLFRKAVLETQKLAARCPQCGAKFDVVSTRYRGDWKDMDRPSQSCRVRFFYDDIRLFLGECPTHGRVWSQEFKVGVPVYDSRFAYRSGSEIRAAQRHYSM